MPVKTTSGFANFLSQNCSPNRFDSILHYPELGKLSPTAVFASLPSTNLQLIGH